MGLKDKVVEEGMKLAAHPALAPLVQDERFMKLVMTALSVPGRLQELTEEQRANVRRALGVASEQSVLDLQRTIRALEDEIYRLRHELAALTEQRESHDGQG